jgi:hypothetical protein
MVIYTINVGWRDSLMHMEAGAIQARENGPTLHHFGVLTHMARNGTTHTQKV